MRVNKSQRLKNLLNFVNRDKIDKVYVCESQLDALRGWTLGLPCIALFGTGSKHQYDILNKSGIRVYNLMFDGDEAGRKGAKRFIQNINCDIQARMAVVYNNGLYFAGADFLSHTHFYNNNNIDIIQGVNRFRLYVGYNFWKKK